MAKALSTADMDKWTLANDARVYAKTIRGWSEWDARLKPDLANEVIHKMADYLDQLADGLDNTTEWQPIETAPKDGMRILTSDGKEVAICEWNALLRRWSVVHDGDDYLWAEYIPAHWQPLPDPPEE